MSIFSQPCQPLPTSNAVGWQAQSQLWCGSTAICQPCQPIPRVYMCAGAHTRTRARACTLSMLSMCVYYYIYQLVTLANLGFLGWQGLARV